MKLPYCLLLSATFLFPYLLSANPIEPKTEVVELKIGNQILVPNCFSEEDKIGTSYSYSESEGDRSAWYKFTTSDCRKTIDLNFKSTELNNDKTLSLFDENHSLVWKSKPENIADFPVVFPALLTNSSYYIEVSSDIKHPVDYEIGLSYNYAIPPPSNDFCDGATLMFGDGILDCGDESEQIFETANATPDPEATGNCVSDTEPATWFTFSTPDPMSYLSLFSALSPTNFELFSSTSGCSGLVYVGCSTGFMDFTLEPNTQYYILLAAQSAFFWIPGNVPDGNSMDNVTECDDPHIVLSTNNNTFIAENICESPSTIVPCENDHVVWLSYTTGCNLTDITITAEPMTSSLGFAAAEEVSIVAVLDDCTTLMSAYDVNGVGYVCSAAAADEFLDLQDIPANTTFVIGFGSNNENIGHFELSVIESNPGIAINDLCADAIILPSGTTSELNNYCATQDVLKGACPSSQSEGSVWYLFEEGSGTQDITIQLTENGIVSPVMAIYNNCGFNLLAENCDDNLIELQCVTTPLYIQVSSANDGEGEFEIDIEATPAFPPPDPIIMVNDICDGEFMDMTITFPGGEVGDLMIDVSGASSPSLTGMTNHVFTNINSVSISDQIFNININPQTAIYTLTWTLPGYSCPTIPLDVPVSVNGRFSSNAPTIDECLPYNLQLDAADVITGGSSPYQNFTWTWNNTTVLSTADILDVDLTESGTLNLSIEDDAACTYEVNIPVNVTEPIDPTFNFPLLYCRADHTIIEPVGVSLEGILGNWDPVFIWVEDYPDGPITFTFTPDDDFCSPITQVDLEIYSGDDLTFNLPTTLCTDIGVYTFPTADANGIQGSWDIPSIDVTNLSGNYTNYFQANSTDCYAEYQYNYEIQDQIVLSFDYPSSVCRNGGVITFETMSQEGYNGLWDIALLDPDTIVGNTFSNTWTPVNGQSNCLEDTSISISIIEPEAPSFNLPTELCPLDTTFIFPNSTTDQSISGTWSVAEIDPELSSGTISSIFTPDNASCATNFEWDITITPQTVPVFTIDTLLCRLDNSLMLPIMSEGGIAGTWEPASIDPATINGIDTMAIFTADSSNHCISPLELHFHIEEVVAPVFNLVDTVCWNNDDIILPLNTENGIEGTWTIPVIQASSNSGTTISTTFMPDDDSCSSTYNHQVYIIPIYAVTPMITDPGDCESLDGIINLTTSTPHLEYSIDGGTTWQSEVIFDQLAAGVYTILIRSTNITSCGSSIEAILTAPDAPNINSIISTELSGCSVSDATITIDATGNNLEYSIDDGLTWQSNSTFIDLPAGVYTVSIRNENSADCILTGDIEIEPYPITEILGTDITSISDCNLADGQIEITATGLNLEYSINSGIDWSPNSIFNNLPAGQYTIIVRSVDAPDCEDSAMVDIENVECPCNDLELALQSFNTDCSSPEAAGVYLASVEGMENPAIDVHWQNGQTSDSIINISSGWQYITITYDEDCEWTDSIYVAIEEPIVFELLTQDADCDISSNGMIEIINIQGGDGNFSFSIDGVNYQNSNIFSNLPPASYEIIVADSDNCLSIQNTMINALSTIEISLPEIIQLSAGDSIVLDPQIEISSIDSFSWLSSTESLDSDDLVINVSPAETTIYTLDVFFGDCTFTGTSLIEVITNEEIYVGNIFNPSGTSNTVFFIQSIPNSSLEILNFQIFDRWGNSVYRKENPSINDPSDGWKGYFKGRLLNPGVYAYLINYKSNDGSEKVLFGSITLAH